MSQSTTESDMLPEDAASDYLGDVPERTLRQWRYLGKGPAYVKVGRHVRYLRSDLDAFVAEHRVKPTDAA
jgi:Helix-turn-helix domain